MLRDWGVNVVSFCFNSSYLLRVMSVRLISIVVQGRYCCIVVVVEMVRVLKMLNIVKKFSVILIVVVVVWFIVLSGFVWFVEFCLCIINSRQVGNMVNLYGFSVVINLVVNVKLISVLFIGLGCQCSYLVGQFVLRYGCGGVVDEC